MRLRLARLIDRLLPRACWPSLWDWSERRDELTLRDAARPNPVCVRHIEANGTCWCGKNRVAPGGPGDGKPDAESAGSGAPGGTKDG